ncbi:hypothetical protein PAPYR_6522 [Paratrimastix pyriformis]|uniref:Uncharacterized protein n=1 Tax=Paratrimastix pyriformis TaxID=342808 RepID=A0ABQ8UIU0_9EUKA|nr:hypothetical protein PAPYR_6522 [Paratrimastix pyriformis]
MLGSSYQVARRAFQQPQSAFPRMRNYLRAIFVGVVVFAVPRVLGLFDFHQCDRRCRGAYGSDPIHPDMSITGKQLSETRCRCFRGSQELGEIDRLDPWNPPILPPNVCCGADGRNYATQEEACAAGTFPLHGGFCGACSNGHDINIYNETRNTLTNTTTHCALIATLEGEDRGRECMEKKVGFTPACNQCWIDNMGCDSAQCLGICLEAKEKHWPPNWPDGSLNDCLKCDEARCGTQFITCAGANRRRCGILSDIERPGSTVWRRYAC